jgi:hypothetical protein
VLWAANKLVRRSPFEWILFFPGAIASGISSVLKGMLGHPPLIPRFRAGAKLCNPRVVAIQPFNPLCALLLPPHDLLQFSNPAVTPMVRTI